MGYVIITTRVVKVNTGATAKFAPRSGNQTSLRVSGPFGSLRQAQRAAMTALSTHTCLDAQIWSDEQIRAEVAKGYCSLGAVKYDAMREAERCLDAARDAARESVV